MAALPPCAPRSTHTGIDRALDGPTEGRDTPAHTTEDGL